jgi:hypothetical protein
MQVCKYAMSYRNVLKLTNNRTSKTSQQIRILGKKKIKKQEEVEFNIKNMKRKNEQIPAVGQFNVGCVGESLGVGKQTRQTLYQLRWWLISYYANTCQHMER